MSDIGLTGGVADAAAGGTQPIQQETQQQVPTDQQGNPAWNEFLNVIPSQLHPQVRPLLEKWDKGVQERFQSQAQQYAPWKPIMEEYQPDTVVGLIQMLENDPRRIYDELANFYGFNTDQGQQQQPELNLDEIQDPEQFNLEKIPEFQQMKLQTEQLRGFVEQQIQDKVQQQAMDELQTEIDAVKEANPGIVEPILLSLAHSLGMTVTEAVPKYQEYMQQVAPQTRTPAPSILSPTGGVPLNNGTAPSEMTGAQRRAMVAQILQAAASENT